MKAVIARSPERIHRSSLVGMGVLPCQFKGTDSVAKPLEWLPSARAAHPAGLPATPDVSFPLAARVLPAAGWKAPARHRLRIGFRIVPAQLH